MPVLKEGTIMAIQKHLTLIERCTIESMLNNSESFKAIGRKLGRHCTTISKEVRGHILFKKTGCFGHPFNDCANRRRCDYTNLCSSPKCRSKSCRNCSNCHLHCPDYFKEYCKKLSSPPYVCNGCSEKMKCTLEKHIYSAVSSHNEYETVRSESRSGVSLSEKELSSLDRFISPLIKKGLSIHHICSNNKAEIMFSEKTIYNYVDSGLFSAINLDLPRKVRCRPRKSNHDNFKVDKGCRTGRSYDDFQKYLSSVPGCPIVQMDSVIGTKGGKVLLTIHFVKAEFMLAFLRERNTAASVFYIFEELYRTLSPENFKKLFQVILTDNGSEFSDPLSLEMDEDNELRTRIFYCDPSAPYQKGAIENNHEFIRRILPKGTSFDNLTQDKINLMMNHINSYQRANLGDRSPYEIFQILYGQDILDALGTVLISPNDINLTPELLK